jgi:hypothetical protein
LGAFFGAVTMKKGGGVASRASRTVDAFRTGSASGKTVRSGSDDAAAVMDQLSAAIAPTAFKPTSDRIIFMFIPNKSSRWNGDDIFH